MIIPGFPAPVFRLVFVSGVAYFVRPMSQPSSDNDENIKDLTPLVASQTDIAPLGRSGPKPEHEKTADEVAPVVDWKKIAAAPEFRELVRAKVRFILPMTLFFMVYYFALPILVGFFPHWMDKPLVGPLNGAYLFALSQFFMAWIIAALYLSAANRFDRMSREIIEKLTSRS